MNFLESVQVRQRQFADSILDLANTFPISVTSWGRTTEHNASLKGSVPNSQHLVWLAVDVVGDPDWDKDAFVKAAIAAGLDVIDETTHLHVMLPR
jgi:hypothetical protein